MDSDLERIARGIGVSAETAEAATSVLSRTEVGEAATTIRPAARRGARPTRPGATTSTTSRRAAGRSGRGCSAVLLVAAVLVGGWFAYQEIQAQLERDEAGRGAGREGLAGAAGGQGRSTMQDWRIDHPRRTTRRSRATSSSRIRSRARRSSAATSSRSPCRMGKPKTIVPNVVGKSRDEAVAELVDADLQANVVAVNSLKPVNEVLAQAPKAGTELIENSTVRINVSKGPAPITVPNVVGIRLRERPVGAPGARLRGRAGGRRGPAAAGIVVGQNPAAGTQQGKGSTVTLQVSEGPATSQVPDVTSQTEADAAAQLAGVRASRSRWSRRSSTTRPSTGGCSRRIRRAAPTPSRAPRS